MFESLKIFLSAAERGSINAAAESCFITPPAAMKRINALEAELGVKLFERSGRGVALTRAGQSYLQTARSILKTAEEGAQSARLAGAGTRIVRAGTSILNPCKPLVDMWNACAERYPQYRIEIVPFTDSVAELSEIYAHLGRRFDVMFGVYDEFAPAKPFNLLTVGKSPFCICVPANHRLAARRSVKISDLAGERVTIVRQGMSPMVDKIRAEMAKDPAISLIDSPEFYDIGVFNRVAYEGVLLLSVQYWAAVHPSVVSVPLEGVGAQSFGIIYPQSPRAEVAAFMKILGALRAAGTQTDG